MRSAEDVVYELEMRNYELRDALAQLLVTVEGTDERLGLMGMVDRYYYPCLDEVESAISQAHAILDFEQEEKGEVL